ncbi:DNA polymerase III subunit alpha [Bacteroidota bacterium]
MKNFTHLHVHTQYSILDGAANMQNMVDKAKEFGMNSLAITDHGSMFGVKLFFETCKKAGIKPIIGCEMYVATRSRFDKSDKEDRSGFHLILLAKNKIGYHNLVKLVSKGWLEGFYYRPRVDKELLKEYSEGLIATSACLGGEVAKSILLHGEEKAGEVIEEYKDIFGEDFYLETQNHGITDQLTVNKGLVRLSKKHNIPLIASNDVHFLNKEDSEAHEILICINTGSELNENKNMKYTGLEYFRSYEEMMELFPDNPEVIDNTLSLAEKIEEYELNQDIILPEFKLPEEFNNQDEYLHFLVYKGAELRYKEITEEIKNRLDFELNVIKNMGFAGYFLIVQDVLNAAREMDVSVGPGRGSAAGSAVAYCTGITDIDPIEYNLLFERFLNPERISMPDIDIDFDEDGREKVMHWVVEKYGKDKVAQIITFGTMAAKMAIRDVARVLGLPLSESNRLAKLVPEGPGQNLKKAFKDVPELARAKNSKNELEAKTLKLALALEGCVRHTGVHACGIIIGPEDLTNHIPLSTSKDSDLYVTQYDGKHIESVGMLKMDFLGLKTLSIIKDAIENIEQSTGKKIDIKTIPYDDKKTFELYQRAETIGTFQFESSGMRSHLKELKPTCMEDLFAMNALYRPGPMEFIPRYIKRKHGKEKVEYPEPKLEEILKPTYGIMVYQEQIMKTAQIMGGFTLGHADILRRAMGKKKRKVMEEQKIIFIEGALKNGFNEKKAEQVFDIMEEFANYGFNRSHSAAYSVVAFQTAYLKAHYPAEYMAAVLSRNLNDIKKIKIFMDECKSMKLLVLGPEINESNHKFNVNKEGNIRFGLGAIKGVGENAVAAIIDERKENGYYKDIYNIAERINLRTVNKKAFEAMAVAGAFDNLESLKRIQYFIPDAKENSFIENLIRYGSNVQTEAHGLQQSLFGDQGNKEVVKPVAPEAEEWNKLEKLNKEKEHIGIYLSAHPLDDYKLEIDNFCNCTINELKEFEKNIGHEIKVAGIVTESEQKITKNNKPYGKYTIEDYTNSLSFMLFSKDFHNFNQLLHTGYSVLISGKVQQKLYNDSELEFKINSITLLSEVKDEMVKNILIKIPVSSLNSENVGEIANLIEKNKGKVNLKFIIFDNEKKVGVEMFSRKFKVDLSDDFLNYLEEKTFIDYKID